MVSSLLADALANPTAVLEDLFDPNAVLDAFPARVSAHFSTVFAPRDALNEIPPLSPSSPPEIHQNRALVRFRAMIQDTSPSPQMYLARRKHALCGGWGLGADDATDRDDSIDYADLRECTVVWAVSVPGESSWCSTALDGTSVSTGHATHRALSPHKFPMPDASHVGAQIKIYESRRTGESLKATDLYTFVGILTSEPLHADLELAHPPFVPTLHVVFSQPVRTTIVPREYPLASPTTSELRDELIAWIADTSLAGDRDAAEWVLLCGIARVQSRTPPILPLTLTLSRFPSPPSKTDISTNPTLSHVLSLLFPVLNILPLSLNTLNATSFAPESKNEDLHSGWLQLPSGSVCLLTESGVTEGKVSERGLQNLRAAQEMMNAQTLEYVFPYSRFEFNTDVAFVVLTEGKRSAFFQTNVTIPLKPAKSAMEFDFYRDGSDVALPSPQKLEMFRALVGGAKIGNVSIGVKTAEFIQEDFVKERQAASSPSDALSSDDLIHRMMLARLLALSLHETEISVAVWEKAKALDTRRKTRISQ
ncbi:putative mini-chromosome maintenance replisome factor [Lyophyllum shimeji]|uniref:Mini-chromosome maintenance replisome factor n=1 Tax=Lyophyllum shimeji TaxID=47721 RepID=A0A9P3PG11_LYOSH|nr:putative mini-chromosome maintenance replisome factor [Lyophyllum shimeji]